MLLEIQNLQTHFHLHQGILKAVDGVSFSIPHGKTLGLVGESGCGKSVTALSIMQLLPMPPARIAGGSIKLEGRELLALDSEQLRQVRGNEIAMIFQEPMTSLNPVFTVGFQVGEALKVHRPGMTPPQIKEQVVELLRLVGLAEPGRRYSEFPHQMSGGMRQRVMIAMGLSCNPKLLLADEPTTALDVTIQAQILELIRSLQKQMGMAVLLVTHDLGVVAETADEVVVMYAGKVVERAAVGAIFSHPKHPYTQGLLDSLPDETDSKESGVRRLKGVQGAVPDLLHLPKGCRFQDRCPLVKDHCREKEPVLEEKEPGHWASCFEV